MAVVGFDDNGVSSPCEKADGDDCWEVVWVGRLGVGDRNIFVPVRCWVITP